MSCPSWQWHRTGSRWSQVRTLPVAPLWCDLEFVPNSRGNKAAANLRPTSGHCLRPIRVIVDGHTLTHSTRPGSWLADRRRSGAYVPRPLLQSSSESSGSARDQAEPEKSVSPADHSARARALMAFKLAAESARLESGPGFADRRRRSGPSHQITIATPANLNLKINLQT